MDNKQIVLARIPVELECPTPFIGGREVFEGEYEVPYFGDHLTILDLGANIGSFALWANLRWPQSCIQCYEPHPGTFEILKRNVGARENVTCVNAAVYPRRMRLSARFAGDPEAALEHHAREMFGDIAEQDLFDVEVIHPRNLPAADVIKVDVEGAELEILRNMNLQEASLILLEYHRGATRARVLALVEGAFALVGEKRTEWSCLLGQGSLYRKDLEGDFYGTLCFANRNLTRMWRNPSRACSAPVGLRELLRNLPGALQRSVRARLRRIHA